MCRSWLRFIPGVAAAGLCVSAFALSTPTVQVTSVTTYTSFFSEFLEAHVSVSGANVAQRRTLIGPNSMWTPLP